MTQEEVEIFLDLSQLTLDLVGIIDPTPISDGTNVAISVGRGDWVGAGISGLSLIPYVGDLAKSGKLGRWGQTIHAAIALAKRNVRFGERVRPVLRKLSEILDRIPSSLLPNAARPVVGAIKKELSSFLGRTRRLAQSELVERYLRSWYRYIDDLPIPAPGKDRGALWSKLDGARAGDGGEVLAGRLAVLTGKMTLETSLEASRFVERYKFAVAQLAEGLGRKPEDLWEHFGKKIWTKVSIKYTQLLEGRVTAYVRMSGPKGLDKAISAGSEPIVVDELSEIAEAMHANTRITSVELIDIVTGDTRLMLREDVLRAARSSH
jgi:hypothetical protein